MLFQKVIALIIFLVFSLSLDARTSEPRSIVDSYAESDKVTLAKLISIGYDADGYRVYRFENTKNVKGESARIFNLRSQVQIVLGNYKSLDELRSTLAQADNNAEHVHRLIKMFDESEAAMQLRSVAVEEAKMAADRYLRNMVPSKGDIAAGQYGVYYGKLSELSPYLIGGNEPDTEYKVGQEYLMFYENSDLPQTAEDTYLVVDNLVYMSIHVGLYDNFAVTGLDKNGGHLISNSLPAISTDALIEKLKIMHEVRK